MAFALFVHQGYFSFRWKVVFRSERAVRLVGGGPSRKQRVPRTKGRASLFFLKNERLRFQNSLLAVFLPYLLLPTSIVMELLST
mmetsp:Transcript_16254/g.41185  ORF Transcript_16254/g.41185 Transcript_16254/m.41185 type:complete len:84 (-) Transcript_16254:48-299(-)